MTTSIRKDTPNSFESICAKTQKVGKSNPYLSQYYV